MKNKFHPLDVPRVGFEILSLLDWITPISKAAQAIKRDPTMVNSWTFFIPDTEAIHAGWSQYHIKEMLQANGITIYGDMVAFGELSFDVPIGQAAKAEELMYEAGIPIHPRSQGAPRR